jgi:hypothetical protein
MKAPREVEVRIKGSADPLWWGVAALLSLGSDRLPGLLRLDGTEVTRALVLGCALFLTGGIVGAVRRKRPWRWAVACFVAYVLRDLAVHLSGMGPSQVHVLGVASFVVGHVGVYFLYSLPVLAGAFLGASIMSAGLE